FTGSVATARRIQQALVERPRAPIVPIFGESLRGVKPERPRAPIVPLIAETGGLNALIADSSALPEQLLDSVVASAFGSAGQRCSALRLLCLHSAMADDMERLLAGALRALVVGPADEWATDVGPVIDVAAQARLIAHVAALEAQAQQAGSGVRLIGRAPEPPAAAARRWPFVTPCAYTLARVSDLRDEHFGPVLHVVRWGPGTHAPSLDELIDQLNASGYGLTL